MAYQKYPASHGFRWSDNEELILLDELSNNISINDIAINHNRTMGGIKARIKEISLKMYNNGISIEEISKKTFLSHNQILNFAKTKKESEKKQNKESSDFNMVQIKDEINLISKNIELTYKLLEHTILKLDIHVEKTNKELEKLFNENKELKKYIEKNIQKN